MRMRVECGSHAWFARTIKRPAHLSRAPGLSSVAYQYYRCHRR